MSKSWPYKLMGLGSPPLYISSDFSQYTFRDHTNIIFSDTFNDINCLRRILLCLYVFATNFILSLNVIFVSLNVYWKKLENNCNGEDLNPSSCVCSRMCTYDLVKILTFLIICESYFDSLRRVQWFSWSLIG